MGQGGGPRSGRASPLAAAAAVLSLLLFVPGAMAAGQPEIGQAWTRSESVTTSTATLRAEINPNGFATAYRFYYLPEAAYLANLRAGKDGFDGALKAPAGAEAAIGSGYTATTVSQAIFSLSTDSPYRYRVQATNSAGTTIGSTHAFATEPFAGAPLLLDGRGWEMVSPVDKNGGQVQAPGGIFGGGAPQAAATGSAFAYPSLSSFGADAQGSPSSSQYLATRTPSGWVTANLTAPAFAGAYGPDPEGTPHRLFSPDLTRAVHLDGRRCPQVSCSVGYSLRFSTGGSPLLSPEEPDLRLAGATSDLSHRVLSTCAALTSQATEAPGIGGCDPAQPNLYLWAGTGLNLINLLPSATQGTPGAALAAPASAISADGSRVYWTAAGNLYLREDAVTKQVDATLGGGGTFETASVDGAVAFLTKDGHLYRYEAPAGTLADLTPSAGVEGVLGASADGAYLYYATANGLQLRHGAVTTTIAPGPVAVDPSSYPPATGTARITPDGTHLAFLSTSSLTEHDNREEGTQQRLAEVFLYDAGADSLRCVSCNPTGERPRGPSTIPGARPNGEVDTYKPRNLSADGTRLFFDSGDSLVLADTGGHPDVYEWEAPGAGSCTRAAGCLNLISAGRNSVGASFLDASASGGDVFFLTSDSLVGADGGFADVYDAREGGGFPGPAKPIECVGDACQFLPSEPEDPTPGTLVPNAGNPPLRIVGTATRCHKGFVRKRGKCVKKKRSHRKGGKKRRTSR